MMDSLVLSEWQFAITTVYHFFFVPLTLGLGWFIAIMETIYVRTGNEAYKQMTKFWGKLFLINFTMGVVTGIVQEFQFGMNWAEYSRFVGDIFGAPLAVEALVAFFLESTFLGLWVFGWDRLSKPLHAATFWLVAIGSNLSALWILIANSFMQEPVGYLLNEVTGRAEMTSFRDLIFNPNVWVMFPHVIFSGLTTAAFFVIGISAYHLLRKQNPQVFRPSFQMATIIGLVAVLLIGINGHSQAQHMVRTQPMKMAAAEALWYSEDPASFSLISITNLAQTGDVFSIHIPRLLSLLAYDRLSGEVKGIYNLQDEFERTYGPGDYKPPIIVTYWSFRMMVGAGTLMGLLMLYAILKRRKLEGQTLLLKILPWAIGLPYLANTTGWLMTELGRQPWVVYGVMKTSEAVSTAVSSGEVLTTLILFTLIYGLLMVVDVRLLVKFAKAGPDQQTGGEPTASAA
jgi:cytochrome d ubiquinol oxidase subunit I